MSGTTKIAASKASDTTEAGMGRFQQSSERVVFARCELDTIFAKSISRDIFPRDVTFLRLKSFGEGKEEAQKKAVSSTAPTGWLVRTTKSVRNASG
eukprot:6213772-Pleurochrysis_carterae.AAC.2